MRKKIKKTAAVLALMILMSAVYTGCAEAEEAETTNETAEQSGVENANAGNELDGKISSITNAKKEDIVEKSESAKETVTPKVTKTPEGSVTAKAEATKAPAVTATPKPASTKTPEKQNTTSSSAGSSASGSTSSSTTAKATEAPASTKAPVVQSTPVPTAVPHEHSWDGGSVTTAASCGSEGTKTYRCSCGETRTEAIPATSHNWVEEVYGEATCTGTAYAYKKCTICDATGEGWTVAALGHDVESYEKHGGDCVSPAQYGNTCRRCGADLGDTYGGVNPNAHSWRTVTSEVFNEETLKWETVTGTYCGNGCGAIQ